MWAFTDRFSTTTMQAISPALTASSSATAYNPSPFDHGDINMDKLDDFSELFDFDQFESSPSVSLPS